MFLQVLPGPLPGTATEQGLYCKWANLGDQRPRFSASAIGRYFEDWIISEEVGFAKPDPRIFDVAYERMDRPPKERVLIVGDSLSSDIAGGIAYGIDTCWFNPSGRKADPAVPTTYEIQELGHLLMLLTRT